MLPLPNGDSRTNSHTSRAPLFRLYLGSTSLLHLFFLCDRNEGAFFVGLWLTLNPHIESLADSVGQRSPLVESNHSQSIVLCGFNCCK